jgi:hypothetical protein
VGIGRRPEGVPGMECVRMQAGYPFLPSKAWPGPFAVVLWLTTPWLPCLCSR